MLVLPSYYLAPISYYAQLAQCEEYSIDTDEAYRKQTLRNRCYIASPNGPLALTIPVVKFVPYHTPMRDIRISDQLCSPYRDKIGRSRSGAYKIYLLLIHSTAPCCP